jgi:hypothetical protein
MSGHSNVDTAVITYLETLAKTDGGYGWEDQQTSHLTVAFCVVCAYHLLGQIPPQRDRLMEYIRENHPFRARVAETRKHIGDPRKFVYQQIQALLWLGGDPGFLVLNSFYFVMHMPFSLWVNLYQNIIFPSLRTPRI